MYAAATTHPQHAGWWQPVEGGPIYLNICAGWEPSDREIVAQHDGLFTVSHIAYTGVRYVLGTFATFAAAAAKAASR